MLSEIIQSEKDKYRMISFIHGIKIKTNKQRKKKRERHQETDS